VYEGKLQDLMATAATTYRLRTRDPDRTRTICLNQPGLDHVEGSGNEMRFAAADEDAVAALSLALGHARVPIIQLVAETATLEELFLGMTGGESSDHDRQAIAS
jgi:hypothetical protein